jgi:hypothetical protein
MGFLKKWLGRLFRVAAILLAVLLVLALVWLTPAFYRRFVRFPQEEKAWAELRADRNPVQPVAGWNEYKGIVHSHSHLSHDCEVPFEEILRTLQETGRDFICLSDHPHDRRADFQAQWRGIHSGKLFIPGFEMSAGFMPFGVASGIILDDRQTRTELARRIVENGGVLFYAHPEEPRDWDRPELSGMEIFNIHAAFRDSGGLAGMGSDILVSMRRYPDQVMRMVFKRQDSLLARWDGLNRTRHITAIGGNDAHQNTGVRGVYTAEGALRIEDTSPHTLRELKLNPVTRFLLKLCCGPLEPGRPVFRLQLDRYDRMARFVTTHVLAKELSEEAVLASLKAGRAFVAFDMIADSSGFTWAAEGSSESAWMGETASFSPAIKLHAEAPNHCRFSIVKNGSAVFQQEGRRLDWSPPSPGKYRVEAELKIRGEWVPWIYANPILLEAPSK